MVVPWLIVPVRLDVSRRLALHLSLLAVIAMNALVFGVRGAHVPEFTAATLVSIFTFFLGAYTSRRLRRQTLDDWSDRRVQARERARLANIESNRLNLA